MKFAHFVAVLLLAGCALPQPEKGQQDFISNRELSGVSLAREGLGYFKKSRFPDAEARFRQSLYIYPDADNIRLNLAITLEQLDQLDEAEKIFEELLGKHPNSVDHRGAYGHFLASAGRFAEAREQYETALDLALEKPEFLKAVPVAQSLSALAFRLGEEESGLCYSEFAYRLTGSVEELVRHTKLLTAAGRFTEARDLLLESGKNIQDDPRLANRMALVQYGLGQTEEAEKFYSITRDVGLEDPQDKFESGALAIALAKPGKEIDDEEQESRESVYKMAEGPGALYLPPELLAALEQAHGPGTQG